jgi:transposase
MTRGQIEVIGVERRRRWLRSEKERLVAASFEPGVSASDVARSAGLHVSQLFRWRKELCERVVPAAPALIPVQIVSTAPSPPAGTSAMPVRERRRAGMIEIGLSGGRRLRVDRDVDAEALRRVLDVLGER